MSFKQQLTDFLAVTSTENKKKLSLTQCTVALIFLFWIITFVIAISGYHSDFLDYFSHVFNIFIDPTGWYNASIKFREQIYTLFSVAIISVFFSFGAGFYGAPSAQQLEVDQKQPIIGSIFTILFLTIFLIIIFNASGSSEFLSQDQFHKLKYTEKLLNNSLGFGVIITVMICVGVNIAYLVKRVIRKLKENK